MSLRVQLSTPRPSHLFPYPRTYLTSERLSVGPLSRLLAWYLHCLPRRTGRYTTLKRMRLWSKDYPYALSRHLPLVSQMPLFTHDPDGTPREKNKFIMGRRNWCAVWWDRNSGEMVFDIRVEKEKGLGESVGYVCAQWPRQYFNVFAGIKFEPHLRSGWQGDS